MKLPKPKIWSLKKADTEFSKWVRDRDSACVRCGKTEYLQNSHFWPRARAGTRFDPKNCDTLCYGCHYGNRQFGWEYAKQGEYRKFKERQLGQEEYDKLEQRYLGTKKMSDAIAEVMVMLGKI